MSDKKGAPPSAFICGECFEAQRTVAGVDEYYCEHNHVWAIKRPDGGWLLSTQISPEDHKALLDDARRMQLRDDNGTYDSSTEL
ncbi:MAG: hypothetical protein KJO55_09540, partial [Gammaproteobacteria bacterium]|nr:hypothetical protein [Gammaproteobacteria bacterium]